eukprot:scaffold21341_cov88-Isochrysis_galbana.AAC.2
MLRPSAGLPAHAPPLRPPLELLQPAAPQRHRRQRWHSVALQGEDEELRQLGEEFWERRQQVGRQVQLPQRAQPSHLLGEVHELIA